jgi:hypothetical protein
VLEVHAIEAAAEHLAALRRFRREGVSFARGARHRIGPCRGP